MRTATVTNTWDSNAPRHEGGPRLTQMGYFRDKSIMDKKSSPSSELSITEQNALARMSGESQPYEIVRVRPRHKVRERIHQPPIGVRTNLGPIVSKRNIKSSDVSGRIAAALDKLFRSKSQKARRVLEYLQTALLGHVIQTSFYLRETAKYLCVCQGITRVYKKPSFKAVRCLISILKDCEATSFEMKTCLRTLSLCIP